MKLVLMLGYLLNIYNIYRKESKKMKGIIVGICGLVLSAHAQFNFEVNNGGFRFGILGSEVVNVGGNNKDQPFAATSFPTDAIPSVLIPNISMPNMGDPFAPIGQITNLIEHKT